MWTRLRAGVSRLTFSLARRRIDEDVRFEIDTHLNLLTERYRRQGMTPDAAYLAARRQFGNPTVLRQNIRDMNGIGWIDSAAQDLRYALRQVRVSAGFASVVVATLGLGIGGATAVFSVVQAVLLAPLPYADPGQLVRFYQLDPDKPDARDVLAGTHFSFLREHVSSFAGVAALAHYSETGLDLVTEGRAERVRVLRVSSGYFDTLGAHLRLGRGFDRDDETGTRRVVLSDTLWHTRFAADPSVVGATIRLSAESYEVAGVAPPGFEDPIAPDVAAWIPYGLARDTYEENNSLTGIGRLRDGVTLEQAQAELATLTRPMRERWPAAKKSAIVATPLREELVARTRPVAAGLCRRGAGSARGLRERRQSCARTGDRPSARVRHTRRAGLGSIETCTSAARREPRAGGHRGSRRIDAGSRRNPSTSGPGSRGAAAPRRRRPQP